MRQQPVAGGILVAAAHHDDAEFTCGGSIACWTAEGWTVYLVVCADGGKGSYDPTADPLAWLLADDRNNWRRLRQWALPM
ncbi:MAG: PIG-L family deacetylase [Chloroflexota bacterium]|nr:PIG-L family deacetylase [Chloroflexota bacterium]